MKWTLFKFTQQLSKDLQAAELLGDHMGWCIISKHLKGCSVPRVSDVFIHIKEFCRFPVSGHFPYSRDFVVSLFPDSFRIQRILSFSCFQTLSVFKGFCQFPVSRFFLYSKDFVVFLFPDTFRIQDILSFSCFQTCSLFKNEKIPWLSPFPPLFAQFKQAERRRREARHQKCTHDKLTLPTRGVRVRNVPVRSVLSRRSH